MKRIKIEDPVLDFIVVLGIFCVIVLLIVSCRQKKITRTEPTRVIYKEVIKENVNYKVERTAYYSFDSLTYDTITKKEGLSVLPPENITDKYGLVPDDKVDLNEVFGVNKNDETDYNFSEIDQADWDYLERLGIFWDDKYGCYRKK